MTARWVLKVVSALDLDEGVERYGSPVNVILVRKARLGEEVLECTKAYRRSYDDRLEERSQWNGKEAEEACENDIEGQEQCCDAEARP